MKVFARHSLDNKKSKKVLSDEKILKYKRRRQQYLQQLNAMYGVIKKYKRGVVYDLSKLDTKKERNDYRVKVNEEMNHLFRHYDVVKAKKEYLDYLLRKTVYTPDDFTWEVDSNGVSLLSDDYYDSDENYYSDDDSDDNGFDPFNIELSEEKVNEEKEYKDDEKDEENEEEDEEDNKGDDGDDDEEDEEEEKADYKEFGEILTLDRAKYEFGNIHVKSKNEYKGCRDNFVNCWSLDIPNYLEKNYYKPKPKSLHHMELRNSNQKKKIEPKVCESNEEKVEAIIDKYRR
jgi:hypothetical protein